MAPPLLRTWGLTVRFDGLTALDRLELSIDGGGVVGMIGPNGAGKTTAIDAITGFVPCTGRVELDGREISGLAPHRRARAGLGRTWQSVELFDDLTVRDNVLVGIERASWGAFAADLVAPRRRTDQHRADDAIELLDVADLAHLMPQELSYGQRVLVGLARAVAAGPRLLCMDEPAAGLDTAESARLAARLRTVADAGTTILVVDHDMTLMQTVCDELHVLDSGVVIASGPPATVVRDERVVQAYLGRSADSAGTGPA